MGLERFGFDLNRGDSQQGVCLIHFRWEVDHGQTLLFGPSGTALRVCGEG